MTIVYEKHKTEADKKRPHKHNPETGELTYTDGKPK